ncbi:MAG: hypothetical protein RL754_222 [Bacteroidota bacterium]|jgi:sodium-dependent dicarboxylate transporter 2/3/5
MIKITPFIRIGGPLIATITAFMGGFSADYWLMGTALWMMLWWITETVDLGITALLPLLVFPFVGIEGAKAMSAYYAHPLVYLFFGGFILALALEKSNLHYRIAIWILRHTGTKNTGLLAGFMIATGFLSMWISNTATAIMMLPIANSVLAVLDEEKRQKISRPILLSVAWSANIGGMATIIGTPPNMIFAGFMSEQLGKNIGFMEWLPYGLSATLILGLVAYALLARRIGTSESEDARRTSQWLREEWTALGVMNTRQKRVASVFVLTAILWIIRPYLQVWIPKVGWSDTGIALIAAISLFVLGDGEEGNVLEWKETKDLPWGILLLFGGGLALAGMLQQSQWFDLLSNSMVSLEGLPMILWLVVMAFLGVFATEMLSNMALVSAFLPLVYSLSAALGLDMIALSLPLVLGASCAFMLPMATPPNAIVFSTGRLNMPYMMGRGVLLNLVSVIVVVAIAMMYQIMG